MQLKGKTVVITGGGKGIGHALALDLAGRGANIALIDVNQADLDSARASVEALGVTAKSYVANVAAEAEVETTFERIAGDFGRLDGVINNAGILRDGLLIKAKDGVVTGKLTLAQWQAVIDVNLTGVFLCAREAAEKMIRFGNGGVIINISSVSRYGNAGQSNYSAAKAGVATLAVVWAKELARYRIRTGAIAPGFTRTTLLDNMKPDMLEKMLLPVPLKRLGEAAEIAQTAAFILENDFFTGRCIDVDGGLRL